MHFYTSELKAEVSRISGCNAKHICLLGHSIQGKIDYWQVKVKEEALNLQEVYSEVMLYYRKVILVRSHICDLSL